MSRRDQIRMTDEESRPFIQAVGEKRYAVRVHVERTVSWDHSKLGGTY